MRLVQLIYVILFCFSFQSYASKEPIDATALSMVPRGEILHKKIREFIIKSPNGTKITLEFERNGKFKEASGLNLNQGDEFEPGMGLISLSSAAMILAREGKKVKGDWNLEKDSTHGWVYELAGIPDAEERIYHLINASSAVFIGSMAQIPSTKPIELSQTDLKSPETISHH